MNREIRENFRCEINIDVRIPKQPYGHTNNVHWTIHMEFAPR